MSPLAPEKTTRTQGKDNGSPPLPRRQPLSARLVGELRQLIYDGDLEPGTRLQEEELSQRFGVSRTPLREALKSLASEGLIKIEPNRGATVVQLSMSELAETFPVMSVLEGLAGELAAAHADDAELAGLRALHDQIVAEYRAGNLAAYFSANQQFHEKLVEAAHNETLAVHYHQLAGRVRRARYRANLSDRRWRQSVSEHEAIITALEARDAAALGPILRAHIDHKFETVRDALERAGET